MSVDSSHASISLTKILDSLALGIRHQIKDHLDLPSLATVAIGPVRNPADFPFCSLVPVETRVLSVDNKGTQYATRVLIEAHANKKDSRSAMRQSLGVIENIKSLFEVYNTGYQVPDNWDSKFGVAEKFIDLNMKEPYRWQGDFSSQDEIDKWEKGPDPVAQTHYTSHTLVEHEGKSALMLNCANGGNYEDCWIMRKLEFPPIEAGKRYQVRLRYVRFGGSGVTKGKFQTLRNPTGGIEPGGDNVMNEYAAGLINYQLTLGTEYGEWEMVGGLSSSFVVQTGGGNYHAGTTTISFLGGGGGGGAAATANILVGADGNGTTNKITSITVTNPGSGYTEAPIVVISSSFWGNGATAKAIIDEDLGTVTSIELTLEFYLSLAVKTSEPGGGGIAITDVSLFEVEANPTTNIITNYPSNPQELVEDTQFVSMSTSSPAEPYKNGFLHSTGAEFDFIYTKPHNKTLKFSGTDYTLKSVDAKTIVDTYSDILSKAKQTGELYIKNAVIKDFVLKPQPKYPVVFVGLNSEDRSSQFTGADLVEYQLVFYIISKDVNRRRESSDASFKKHLELVEKIQDILIHNLDAKGMGLNGEIRGTMFGQSKTAEGLLFTSSISLSVQILDFLKFKGSVGPYTQRETNI